MRIALISDIHGNQIALEAVVAAIERDHPDQVVCLGDLAVTGPHPREALALVRGKGWPVVMGNTDAWLLDPQPLAERDDDTARVSAIEQWGASQLSAGDLAFVRTFAPTIEIQLGSDATLLCFHGSPRSNTEIIRATTPDEELAPMFAGSSALIFAGGHTHTQMLRRFRQALIINPGSVGLPYEHLADGSRNPPWAEYALIDYTAGRLDVAFRRVPIDAGAVAQAIRSSGMPHAEWLASDWG